MGPFLVKQNGNRADSDSVMLVLTEMVTNSFRHGSAPVTVDLVEDVHMLMLCVSDGSSEKPLRPTARTGDEGGRGLTIFDALTIRWGSLAQPRRRQDRVVRVAQR